MIIPGVEGGGYLGDGGRVERGVLVHPRRGNGPVAFQPGRVPDLSLDGEGIQLDGARAKLHTDGGAAVVVELILGETGQQVAFPHTGFTY